MNIKDIFLLADLSHIQGIERELRRRKIRGVFGSVIAILIGVAAVLRQLLLKPEEYNFLAEYLVSVLDKTRYAIWYWWLVIVDLFWGGDRVPDYEIAYDVLGFYLIVLGIIIYLLNQHTAFMFQKSQEPFQYTFWIGRFTRAEDWDEDEARLAEDNQIHHLLHHDLMHMLNQRIGRFSLLGEESLSTDSIDTERHRAAVSQGETSPSHIHIDGHYALRSNGDDGTEASNKEDAGTKAKIQIMPRVRIGSPSNPYILTSPVVVDFADQRTVNPEDKADIGLLSQAKYEEIREQVYAAVASEIYKQIRLDLEQKMHLFPTQYLRAVALYHEAEDFCRSNTIDSYDYALELYREALSYYDVSIRSVLSRLLRPHKVVRWHMEYELMYARTRIGWARCLNYRQRISAYTGRQTNDLYEVPKAINQVVDSLKQIHDKFHFKIDIRHLVDSLKQMYNRSRNKGESIDSINDPNKNDAEQENTRRHIRLHLAKSALTYTKDSWRSKITFRLDQSKFHAVNAALFDAYSVLALTYAGLDDPRMARENLDNAKAVYPGRSDGDAPFLVANAESEPNLDKKIALLQRATELDPDFEIAHFLLARTRMSQFLLNPVVNENGEIDKDSAKSVAEAFTEVVKINPSNIASYTCQGYLYWLAEELCKAREVLKKGIRTKTIARQTFIGELNYGLARIAAEDEEGNLYECHDKYSEALSIEPGLGSYGTWSIAGKTRILSYYDYMSAPILSRYMRFKDKFETRRRKILDSKERDTKRENFEGETAPLILNQIYSYILNDYGNACLSYFHRLGQNSRLEDAIASYREAIDLHSTNPIAHYNLANAIEWHDPRERDMSLRQEQVALRTELFQKALEVNPYTWPAGIVALAKLPALLIRQTGVRKRQLEGEIHKSTLFRFSSKDSSEHHNDESLLRELRKQFKKNRKMTGRFLSDDADISTKQDKKLWTIIDKEIYRDKQNGVYSHYQYGVYSHYDWLYVFEIAQEKGLFANAATNEIEQKNTLRPSEVIPHKIESLLKDLQNTEQALDELQSLYDKIFHQNLRKMFGASKLPPFIEGFNIERSGRGVTQFLNLQLDPGRLDANDVEVLKGWAELLLTNEENSEAIQASLALHEYILEYTSQPWFDFNTNLFRIYQNLEHFDNGVAAGDESLYSSRNKYSPYIKITEIKTPCQLLDSSIFEVYGFKLKWSESKALRLLREQKDGQDISEDRVKVKLTLLLNKLIERRHRFSSDPELVDGLSAVARELIELEQDNLTAYDVARVNRRLLEDLFPTELARSNIELYRWRIYETIRDWLIHDPILFAALDEWAKRYLLFPHMEKSLKNAIQHALQNSHSLPNCDHLHRMLAELYVGLENPDNACNKLGVAIDEAIDDHKPAIYYVKLAQILRRNGDLKAAREQLLSATEISDQFAAEYKQEIREIYKAEVDTLIENEQWPQVVQTCTAALEEFPQDSVFKPLLRRAEKEQQQQKANTHYDQGWIERRLDVIPIIVEVASKLSPVVAGDGGNKIERDKLIEYMRESIRMKYGVRVPLVMFREHESTFSDYHFLIYINEIPVVWEYIPSDVWESTENREMSTESGFAPDESAGSLGSERVVAYLLDRLKEVLLENLDEFVGHQEVFYLIQEVQKEKLQHYTDHVEDLTRLTAILKALAGERVPMGEALESILSYVERHKEETDLASVIRNIKLLPDVRSSLPGNHHESRYVGLDGLLEDSLQNGAYMEDQQFLALPPETAKEVLTVVRSGVGNQEDNAVLVANSHVRSLVNQLIRLDGLDVPVISQEESSGNRLRFGEREMKLLCNRESGEECQVE